MIGSLLSQAVERSTSAPRIGLIWVLSIALFASIELAFLQEASNTGSRNLFAAILLAWAMIFFLILWKASRILGLATPAEPGAVGPWFGWNMVGISLSLAGLGYLFWTEVAAVETLANTLATSLFTTLLVAIMAPFLAHSAGRAITRNGPSIKSVLRHWRAKWHCLAISVIAVAVPFGLVVDALSHFLDAAAGFTGANMLLLAGISLISAADFVISTAIYVVAYEVVVAGPHSEPA